MSGGSVQSSVIKSPTAVRVCANVRIPLVLACSKPCFRPDFRLGFEQKNSETKFSTCLRPDANFLQRCINYGPVINNDVGVGVSDGLSVRPHVCLSHWYYTQITIDNYSSSTAQYTPPSPMRRNCFVASASAV